MRSRGLLVCAMMGFVGVASAQMSMAISGKFMIYMKPEVKKELKITKDQDKRISEAIQDVGKKMQEGGVAIDFTNMFKPMDDALVAELDNIQRARLDELYLQFNGAAVLRYPDRATQFNLTDDQKAEIKTINKQLDADVAALMQAQDRNMIKKQAELVKKASDAILEKLTQDQRDAWTTAMGKEFKFKS